MLENYDPCEQWYDESWQLDSDSLFDKFGFVDGNLFENLYLDNEINPWLPEPDVLLKLVVINFLLPALSCDITLYEANTSHNRVRAEEGFKTYVKPITIKVTGQQIFEMLENTK